MYIKSKYRLNINPVKPGVLKKRPGESLPSYRLDTLLYEVSEPLGDRLIACGLANKAIIKAKRGRPKRG